MRALLGATLEHLETDLEVLLQGHYLMNPQTNEPRRETLDTEAASEVIALEAHAMKQVT